MLPVVIQACSHVNMKFLINCLKSMKEIISMLKPENYFVKF